MSAFRVGDRVVVVSSGYESRIDPNLGVGNSGVISGVLNDVFLVVMDKGPLRTPYVGSSGWAFYGRELRHENERGKP